MSNDYSDVLRGFSITIVALSSVFYSSKFINHCSNKHSLVKIKTFQLVNFFSLTLKVKINIKEERKSN